jgi:hypothetical protein
MLFTAQALCQDVHDLVFGWGICKTDLISFDFLVQEVMLNFYVLGVTPCGA